MPKHHTKNLAEQIASKGYASAPFHMDGQIDKIKGRIKQAVGGLFNNKRLKAEGKADEFRGTVKDQVDQVADKLKEQL